MQFPWQRIEIPIIGKNVLGILLLVLVPIVSTTDASWLIDPEKFAVSVHRDNSCQDCHEAIRTKDLHPNPANVNKRLSDFFFIDQCANCHEDIITKLKNGLHGKEKIAAPDTYNHCIRCHDPHVQPRVSEKNQMETKSSPIQFSDDDKACMSCHGLVKTEDPENSKRISQFCFQCHAQNGTQIQKLTAERVALIDPTAYPSVPHSEVSCLVCHPQASAYGHDQQTVSDCRQCHLPHDEKTAHDAHMNVACSSCHLQDIHPVRESVSGQVVWKSDRKLNAPLRIHEMIREYDESDCKRCHISGNTIGAVAMILPAKSIICMPCHTATFSIGDTTTILTLVIFLFGLTMMLTYVLTGSMAGTTVIGPFQKCFKLIQNGLKSVFSTQALVIIRTLITDVLLQQRLYRQSHARWAIHSLIFFPFVFRFLWGIVALLASIWKPEWQLLGFMLDKNHPVTAFWFDLTGIMIIMGALMAFYRGKKYTQKPSNLPRQDRLALVLIGGIILIGFILEGVRMAMTGWPEGSAFAFVGYAFSLLFAGSQTIQIYGYLWYLHAILAGLFIAYLPFSRLIHIIMAPIVLMMNSVAESQHGKTIHSGWNR